MDAEFFKLVTQQTGALAVAMIAMGWLRADGLRRIEELKQREQERAAQAEAAAAREREDKLRLADVLDRNTQAIAQLSAAVQHLEHVSRRAPRAG